MTQPDPITNVKKGKTMTTKNLSTKQKLCKKQILRHIVFAPCRGLHLVFVRKKSEIKPFLKSIGCDEFYFFDTSKAGSTQEGSTICFWGDKRNRDFDYNEVIAKKRAYAVKEKRVFLFTSAGKRKLEREFPSFNSISTVIGDKKLSLQLEKCQNGHLGVFPMS